MPLLPYQVPRLTAKRKQANELARLFYAEMGYCADKDYRFDVASHPQERLCWSLACIAQKALKK